MKINLESKDFCYTDFNYEDFERINCVTPGIKGIHEEPYPSRDAYERQSRQLDDSDQTIYELSKINDDLHNDLYNETCEKNYFYHKIILRDFIVYLRTSDIFVLYMTLDDIKKSVMNFEKSYKKYQLEEISDYYLTYIKILSFFQNILEKDEKFLRIKDYYFNTFRKNYDQYLRIDKKDFDNLFIKSTEYGKRIYEQVKVKNSSEIKRLINNL